MGDSHPDDVEAILANLQEELSRHRAALVGMGVIEPPDPLANVRQRQWVNPHLPIGWPTMPRGLLPKLIAYAQKLVRRLLRWYINPIVDQQNALNAALSEALAHQEAEMSSLRQRAVEQGRQVGQVGSQAAVLAQGVAQTVAALDAERLGRIEQAESLRLRLLRLENRRPEEPAERQGAQAGLAPLRTAKLDYFALGALYRNEVQMGPRLSDYDDLFERLAQAQAEGRVAQLPVLDLGAGRGEFVQHLVEMGLEAYGIDIDADAVSVAQGSGRNVRCEDAFAHLDALPDESLGAVVTMQVVEHFSPEELLALFRLIVTKLAPGGFLLAETINPTCLTALANWYLLDPSHRMPVHPELARFLLEQSGFCRIETRYLHPVPEPERLQAVPQDEGSPALIALAAETQRNTVQLNDFLFGPQDYAVVAYRPEE